MTTQIEFSRPNKSVPWGFSIQGGKEFGCPLSVLKVTSGSIAQRLGVVAGDFIIKINDQRTDAMTHQQAIIQIQNLKVELEIKRAQDINQVGEFPPPPILDNSYFNNSCRISTSIGEFPPPPSEISITQSLYCDVPKPKITVSTPTSQPLKKLLPSTMPQSKESAELPTNNVIRPEYNKPKDIPPIVLDKKNLELFHQQIGNGNNKSNEPSLDLRKLIQNQINQPRESKDDQAKETNQVKNDSICHVCKGNITGAYIETNNKVYCKHHFCCRFCGNQITGNKFIETKEGNLYCMEDYANNIAAKCYKCNKSIVEEQTIALGKCWHLQCFVCEHCEKPIGQGHFHTKEENGIKSVYCERDYKDHYEIKCSVCMFPIESDDKYLLVASKNYHVTCYKK